MVLFVALKYNFKPSKDGNPYLSHHFRGILYFSHENDNGTTFIIEQASLDGSNRRILLNSSQPVGNLNADLASNRLYFVRKQTGAVDYMDLLTFHVQDVVPAGKLIFGYKKVESITIYKDVVYFTDASDSTIEKCDKTTCANRSVVHLNKDMVYSLTVFHSGGQKNQSVCATKKCDHLCLAKSRTEYACKCAIGYNVDPNNSSKCIGESEFILYSIGHELRGVRLENVSLDDHVLAPIPRISLATNIDYHHKYDLLFFADSDKGEITSIRRDGTNRRVIVNQTEQFEANSADWLSGIAVDWIADNIYWCDEKRNIIEVSRLNGSLRYVVLSYVNKPKTVAVDPVNGFLFYTGGDARGKFGSKSGLKE